MVINKKSISVISLVLCIVLIACCFSFAGAADYSVTFISVNDMLLDLKWMPYVNNGVIYVPYIVFTDYGLGIRYSYFTPPATAMIYDSNHTIIFEISSGRTYDLNDTTYDCSAIMRNGTVYLPLDFMCSYFGLSYSYITGSEWGDIVRVTNANVVLQDRDFQRAASSLMESRYKNYVAAREAEKAKETPSPTPAPTPVPTPVKTPDPKGHTIQLGFTGVPTADMLKQLKDNGFGACFYLTAEEIRENADMVRGLFCSGFNIGVLITENAEDEYEAFCAALSDAAHIKSVLCTVKSDTVTEDDVKELGLVPLVPDVIGGEGTATPLYSFSSVLDNNPKCNNVVVYNPSAFSDSFAGFMSYLKTEKYTPLMPSEIS